MDKAGKIFIPDNDKKPQIRICVAARSGLGGHRGLTATAKGITDKLHWTTSDADIKAFVQSCLVCTLSAVL